MTPELSNQFSPEHAMLYDLLLYMNNLQENSNGVFRLNNIKPSELLKRVDIEGPNALPKFEAENPLELCMLVVREGGLVEGSRKIEVTQNMGWLVLRGPQTVKDLRNDFNDAFKDSNGGVMVITDGEAVFVKLPKSREE